MQQPDTMGNTLVIFFSTHIPDNVYTKLNIKYLKLVSYLSEIVTSLQIVNVSLIENV